MKWSDDQDPPCFVCAPASGLDVIETPWDWSMPRALCVTHKQSLTLDGGGSLDDALHRVEPPDGYLEGSGLNLVFNPVWVPIDGQPPVKGWTDFAAGGMAVWEDRFGAADLFECHALDRPLGVDLLYAIGADRAFATMDDFYDITRRDHDGTDRPADLVARICDGHHHLAYLWNSGLHLRRRRAATGRTLPQSWDELLDWIGGGLRFMEPERGTEAAFRAALKSLAARRFPHRLAP